MIPRIGGELDISTEMISGPTFTDIPHFPKPYLQKLNTGRAALYAALKEILNRRGKKKGWVPAFICPSVIATFRLLGFDLEFYGVGDTLTERMSLEEKIAEGETFFYVHYFGKKNTAISEWIASMGRSKDFFLIEDCVQASLNSNVGQDGDFAITSYRKFLPQPDGAFLWSTLPMEIQLASPDEEFISSKFLGKFMRSFMDHDDLYLDLFLKSEQLLDHDFEPRRMSWFSAFLMARTDIAGVSQARQKNWRLLHELIHHSPSASLIISPLFHELSEGEVPVGFPVKVSGGKRDSLRRYLVEQKIYCPVHWDLLHLQKVSGWNLEKNLSRSILTLPIDQRLDEEQLHSMIQGIESFEEK